MNQNEINSMKPHFGFGTWTSEKLAKEVERLNTMIDKFWKSTDLSYDIEPREFFEDQAPKTGDWNPLQMALHHIWKRDPKVEGLMEVIKKCAEKFREYEKIHSSKAQYIGVTHPEYGPTCTKEARNREMAEMCEEALK